jgi:hypothetical protein
MSDPLANFKFKTDGLFVRLSADTSPRKMRILTTDPVVSNDKFGNTRFAFIVWDYNESKARILNTTPGVAKQIQAIHQDEDFGADIKKVDVKIVTTGSDLETRHVMTALPKSETLTNEQIKECQEIDLDEKIENGQRMSFYNSDNDSGYKNAKSIAQGLGAKVDDETVLEDISDEPIDINEIPF